MLTVTLNAADPLMTNSGVLLAFYGGSTTLCNQTVQLLKWPLNPNPTMVTINMTQCGIQLRFPR